MLSADNTCTLFRSMHIFGMSFLNGLFHIIAEHFKGSGVRTLIWPLWSAEYLLFEGFCCWFTPVFLDHKQTLWDSAPDITRNSLVPVWLQAVQIPRQQNSPRSLHSPTILHSHNDVLAMVWRVLFPKYIKKFKWIVS